MTNRAVLLLLLLLLPASCGTVPPASSAPPEIIAGRSTAHPDGRIITDLRFAASLTVPAAETIFFDDIGRLVGYLAAHDATDPAAWVYDYDSLAPIPAATAHYVAARDAVTPRGSGLLAVGDAARAEALARATGGRVLTWADLPGYLAAAAGAPPPAPPPQQDNVQEVDGLR